MCYAMQAWTATRRAEREGMRRRADAVMMGLSGTHGPFEFVVAESVMTLKLGRSHAGFLFCHGRIQ